MNASCVFCDVKLRFETVDKASCVFLSASGLEQSAVLVEESKDLFKQAPVSQQSLIMHLILAGVLTPSASRKNTIHTCTGSFKSTPHTLHVAFSLLTSRK